MFQTFQILNFIKAVESDFIMALSNKHQNIKLHFYMYHFVRNYIVRCLSGFWVKDLRLCTSRSNKQQALAVLNGSRL